MRFFIFGCSMGLLVLMLAGCRLTAQSRETTATPAPAQVTGRPLQTNAPPATTPSPVRNAPTPRFVGIPDCPQAPPIRLIVQERGRVTDTNDERLNVRLSPGTDYRILTAMAPNETFLVLDGPICEEGYAWFRVIHDGIIGWIAEGDLGEYYAEPYLPG